MLFEGTGKYFWLIFLIFLIAYITVKISLAYIFKTARISSWKAFIPIYCRLLLVDKLDLKRTVFYKTLIPFVNLYYYYIIIQKLLEAYNMNNKDAIYYILIPMYKFPELVFRRPQFMLHMYDNTEAFINDEKTLFEKEPVKEIDSNVEVPKQVEEMYTADNVFLNSSLEPDERKETIVEAKVQVEEEAKPINVIDNKPKVCPKCGTKLEPTAKICFFCGTEVS
ncbi:MAG: zinc ribbon domain-containing protein [Bacilli bacterium]|nr:zinc ribbon domain-containing protein [Bacilli bacterium]